MIKRYLQQAIDFVRTDVWRLNLNTLPRYLRGLVFPLRIILIAIRGFREDKISIRASALTYFSMLSVVPIVAMGFGIAKGFGLEQMLEEKLMQSLSGQQEVIDYIISFANSFLESTQGGLIAGIGILILLWTVLKVFMNIEESFNAIWQVHKARTWPRKISDYLTMMLIAPILLIMSTSANVFITTQITQITEEVALLGFISPLIFFFIKLIPYVLFWLVLTVIYMVMPNTKVDFKSALVAGIIAGTIFVFVQWAYIHFQVGVSRYNAIYGSFAALPLFLIWLQISWVIVLLGAEISFSVQNVEKYEFDPDIQNLNLYSRKVLTLMIVRLVVRRFVKGELPLTSKEISKELEIPIRLVRDTIHVLVDSHVFSEVTTPHDKEKAYQPARDVNMLTVSYILHVIEHHGADKILAVASKEKVQIENILDKFDQLMKESDGSKLLNDIG
ncbi:MAG: YihY/virulence factor BrkB family protein [Salinivirgaceae bacterium]